jgi:hypothetical protein
LYGIHNAGEFRQQIVTGGVHYTAPMLRNERGHQAPIVFQCPDRPLLIRTHKSTETNHIRAENGGQLSFEAISGHWVPSKKVGTREQEIDEWAVFQCGRTH